MKLRIDEIFVFIAENEEGEGVMGFRTKDNVMMPMVAADAERLELLLPIARAVSAITGTPWKLVRFSTREEVTIPGA